MLRDAECQLVVGSRGAGKTTLLERKLAGNRRCVVWTTKREDFRAGYDQASNRRQLLSILRRNWNSKKGVRVCYRPREVKPGDDAPLIWELHHLVLMLKAAQDPYADGRDTRKLTLVVDEIQRCFPHHRPKGANAFRWAILEGRSWGLELIAATQRPTLIPPDFRDNVDEFYVMKVGGNTALDNVVSFVGRDHAERIRRLEKRQVLIIRDGRVAGPVANDVVQSLK